MARAVSRIVTGNVKDVLAGTTVGVLPNEAPGYDVEVQLATAATADARNATLLVNGVAVMQNSLIPRRDQLLIKGSNQRVYGGSTFPRGDSPTTYFRAPRGARLTLNLSGVGASDVTGVYVLANEAPDAPAALALTHIAGLEGNKSGNELNVLSGTPVGSIPTTASLWNVAIQAAQVLQEDAVSAGNFGSNITFLVDEDTVCENFIIPRRVEVDWPNDERDTLVTALVTGGSNLTLNISQTAIENSDLIYKVYVSPVA